MRVHKQIEELRNGEVGVWYNDFLSQEEAAILMQTIQDTVQTREGIAVLAIHVDIAVGILAVKRPSVDTESPKSRLAMLLNAVKDECVKMADYEHAADALELAEKIRKENIT